MAGKTPDTGCRVGVGNGVNVYEVAVGAAGGVDDEWLPETQDLDTLCGPQVGSSGGGRDKESVGGVLGEAERTRETRKRSV